MKSSLRRLRGLGFHKKRREEGLVAHQDELLRAAEDIHGIRSFYDSLLSAAAVATNSAYEFSEALGEYGTCLLEKTALNDDETSGKALSMLGKAQLELQKIANIYRAHVVQTITTPSESLLKELHIVEEMKRQCDDKRTFSLLHVSFFRDIYKLMLTSQRESGRSKNAKGESFSLQQLQAAQNDYEEEATLFLFRLKSLKQGQSRSLLTQAARHYASQLNFFRRGVKSLEVLESCVKAIAEKQHIDYQFSGLVDDQLEEYADHECNPNDNDGELSFDYEHHNQHRDVSSFSRNSIEENLERAQDNYLGSNNPRVSSISAPLFSTKASKPSERITQIYPSAKTAYTYALPTPLDVRSSTSTSSGNSLYGTLSESKGGRTTQHWHSSPLPPNMIGKDSQDVELPSPTSFSREPSVLKESNSISNPTRMPSTISKGVLSKLIPMNEFDSKLSETQTFSVPLTSKPLSSKQALFASKSMSSMEVLPEVFAKPKNISTPKLSVPRKGFPNASSPLTSPRINELHELPRPPTDYAKHRSSTSIGHSAPLVSRGQEVCATSKPTSFLSYTAAPLPKPPGVMARSFSIPSTVQKSNSKVAKPLDLPHSQKTITHTSSTHTPLVNDELA
ncbi:hypothetical protein ZIOFF_030646 [Zingiber officinale]|uniref:Hydroxyproline-rich glycoprotein family protein n=1 Tax=Zingiber officinale TaxID=94328 RepID=A0A8J5GRI8_ZINOF|nr:hypothetical protein ZIOFF_030646 [Zingiber officinale]